MRGGMKKRRIHREIEKKMRVRRINRMKRERRDKGERRTRKKFGKGEEKRNKEIDR